MRARTLGCALAAGCFAVGCAVAPPPEPTRARPELPVTIGVQATGRPQTLLVEWDPTPVSVALEQLREWSGQAAESDEPRADAEPALDSGGGSPLGIERAALFVQRFDGTAWRAADLGAPHDTRYNTRLFEGVEPGRYRFRVELRSERDVLLGTGESPEVVVDAPENRLRFLDLTADLGLTEPLGLQVLLAFAWPSEPGSPEPGSPEPGSSVAGSPVAGGPAPAPSDVASALRHELERMAPQVLEAAVGGVHPVDLDRLRSVEISRDLLLERAGEATAAGSAPALPHSLGAQVLAVVTLLVDEPVRGAAGQEADTAHLGLRLYDVSYRSYQVEQTERKLWNTRPLVFEDSVELDVGGLADGELVGALIAGWRELLAELARDPYVTRYREFLSAHSGPRYWIPANQAALLNVLGLDLDLALQPGQLENFDSVERELLFLRDEPHPRPGGQPGEGSSPVPTPGLEPAHELPLGATDEGTDAAPAQAHDDAAASDDPTLSGRQEARR